MLDIKTFRRYNRISQKELAAYLEVGQGFISQMERHARPIPGSVLEKLRANPKWEIRENMYVSPSFSSEDPETLDRETLIREVKTLRIQVAKLDALNQKYLTIIENSLTK